MKRVCIKPNYLRNAGDEYEFVPASQGAYGLENLIRIRCGQCINCRIHRAMEWKIRGIHEQTSTFHPTYAVTLTYNDQNISKSGSLVKWDLQRFHKRLRYHCGDFRFLACGEYGPTTGRAHYHGVYFGLKLPDAYKGHHWGSRTLLDAWGLGQVSFHLATPESIGYVSGYVVKKLRSQAKHLPVMETVDFESGLVIEEEPVSKEFLVASNKPGLGRPWIEQFQDEIIRDGYIVLPNGKKTYVIPSFYMKVLRDHPEYEQFQSRRAEHADPDLPLDELVSLGVNVEKDLAYRNSRAAF